MPKADQTSTTPTTSPSAPSISALIRLIADTHSEHACFDNAKNENREILALLLARQNALFEVIATLPALSLKDAAFQVGVAFIFADILDSCEWSNPEAQEKLDTYHTGLRRLILSALPHIAAAAELDMKALGWDYVGDFRDAVFFGIETEVAKGAEA